MFIWNVGAFQARHLRSLGIKIFAVGIGAQVTDSELDNIASDREHIFKVNSFSQLSTLKNVLETAFCEGMIMHIHYNKYIILQKFTSVPCNTVYAYYIQTPDLNVHHNMML